ncbi:hypothetical protein Pen02_62190 [Plantactinospora endophytica]|uniref:Uncharacterized protein n=1 Tax=Plantactinospora endophytica TaxID=673535 RepID=A0ABQ4E982_9ACTN|nr:hypothetical protein Pen02_62190 [Plantactinospora endophytica]
MRVRTDPARRHHTDTGDHRPALARAVRNARRAPNPAPARAVRNARRAPNPAPARPAGHRSGPPNRVKTIADWKPPNPLPTESATRTGSSRAVFGV